jgi:phosphohistidine phosphatase
MWAVPEVTTMDLYLMQHGEATTEAENPERPLTEAGRTAVQRVSARARAVGVHVGVCVHSGKLRAEETARLFVSQLGDAADVSARGGLAPGDAVAPTAQWLRSETEHDALAMIGHLPFLDRLASLLVAGDEEAHVVRFRMGGLVKLEPKDEGEGFSVAWALPPELA